MKNVRTLITICLLLTAFSAVTAIAQTPGDRLVTVNVPFAFSAGDQALPAGAYTIYSTAFGRMIQIMSDDRKHTAFVRALPNFGINESAATTLTFHKYGSEFFLARISTQGESLTREVLVSKRAIELARTEAKPQTVLVAALHNGR